MPPPMPRASEGLTPKPVPGERLALDLQLGAQVGVAAVVVQRHERVEQVHAAGQEDRHQHRRVGRGRGVGRRGLEHALERHGLGACRGPARRRARRRAPGGA